MTVKSTLSAAGGAIAVTSGTGSIVFAGAATANNDVELSADAGFVIVNGAVTSAAGSITAKAEKSVTTAKEIKANQNVTLTSTDSIVQTKGTVTAEEGSVAVEAKNDITANDAVQGKQGVSLQSSEGAVLAASAVTAEEGSVAVEAKNDITANDAIHGKQGVSLQSAEGTIHTASTVTAEEGNVIAAAKGDLDMVSGVITAKDLTLYSEEGSVGTTGTVLSANPIRTDISGSLDAYSTKSVVVHQESNEHDLTLKSVVSGGEIRLISDKGIEMEPAQSEEANGYLHAGDHITLMATKDDVGNVGKLEPIRILANNVKVTVLAAGDAQIV